MNPDLVSRQPAPSDVSARVSPFSGKVEAHVATIIKPRAVDNLMPRGDRVKGEQQPDLCAESCVLGDLEGGRSFSTETSERCLNQTQRMSFAKLFVTEWHLDVPRKGHPETKWSKGADCTGYLDA